MFVAVYRWRVHPEREGAFRVSWRRITELVVAQSGSGGSHLFRNVDGTFVGIAIWPNRAAWEPIATFDDPALATMREAIVERFETYELESLDNLWTERLD